MNLNVPDVPSENREKPSQGFLLTLRGSHDRDPGRYHASAIVQRRVSAGLTPCPFCQVKEVQL